MADAHAHDWTDIGTGTTACKVSGCQAARHEHRYVQDARGRWCCACGAWAPKPPPKPGQIIDLSGYNVRPFKPRASRKTARWR